MREFIVSCSRINQSNLQCVSIWTKTNYSSWIGLVQQVCDLWEIAPFWGCISPTVCPLLPNPTCELWSLVGCVATLKCNEEICSLLSSATHLFFPYHFRVEIMFTRRRGGEKMTHEGHHQGSGSFILFFLHYQKHYLNKILWGFELLS